MRWTPESIFLPQLSGMSCNLILSIERTNRFTVQVVIVRFRYFHIGNTVSNYVLIAGEVNQIVNIRSVTGGAAAPFTGFILAFR